jgi:hypothetical protein
MYNQFFIPRVPQPREIPASATETPWKLSVECFHMSIEAGMSEIRALELCAETFDDSVSNFFGLMLTNVELGNSWSDSLKSTAHTLNLSDDFTHLFQLDGNNYLNPDLLKSRIELYDLQEKFYFEKQTKKLSVNVLKPLGLFTLPSFIFTAIFPFVLSIVNSFRW